HPSMMGVITVVSTMGTEQYQTTDFKIFPNPGRSDIKIELPNYKDNMQVRIFNILGEKIFDKNISSTHLLLDISQWSNGIYMVQLNAENTSVTKRFVKN